MVIWAIFGLPGPSEGSGGPMRVLGWPAETKFWCNLSQIKDDVFEKNPLLHMPYFGPKWPFFGPEAQILAQKPKNIVLEAS